MRRRLVTTYVLLLCLVLLALEIPLAVSLTGRETERVLSDRIADTTRLASLAVPAVRSGEFASLLDELGRYHELYGIGATFVDLDRRPWIGFGGDPLTADHAAAAVRGALAGRVVGTPGTLWPWESRPLVVAVPVDDGGAVLGAIVTVSPTGDNRGAILLAWAQLGLLGAVAVAVCVLAALRLAGWVLHPVTRLDAVTHEIAAGHGGARVHPGVGPPELRRLSASFNEMADAVAESLERQRSFVAHASHQLRNPLTVLRLRVESLGTALTDDDAREDHRFALEETDRFAEMLDGLLALARAERGGHRTETVDAVEAVRRRGRAWLPLTAHRDVTLRVTVPDGPRYVQQVATALDQSLDALIDNALKFTPAGGTVEVGVATRDGGVEVTVRDTGPGMTEEQCRHATERFWRAPDAQNVDGAGLGLPIVAALVDASGGRLTLAPAPTGGLEARIHWQPGTAPAPREPAAATT
ncbi:MULTISPECIES: sensor histidine kinase [Catenuloplanes]|uniref:histidine kinase n=1 Tax=Catenuloplanes niger TaxID=587534 RepID=A0AAE3ZXK9_9ACTN|nr:HAMP domain-containing sensor histidine kinase [Catenuloplanes niger]MDR7325973.1 signal transduction histidine kinase [Catenuloplanes niger]